MGGGADGCEARELEREGLKGVAQQEATQVRAVFEEDVSDTRRREKSENHDEHASKYERYASHHV